jgi:ribosomal protein S12 methylthiotransferase
MKETVSLVSLGCPKNLVDSEVMLGLLKKDGYLINPEPSEAQILIVNTCAFVEDATKEAIDTILRLSRYKREGRCRLLVVCGCLAQRYGKKLEKELPEVDLFVGTGAFQKIPELLSRKPEKKSVLTKDTFLYDESMPRLLSTPSFSAYLKIAEGCSKRCTFCTVPKIRGPYRSRRIESVVREARSLTGQGVRELILIAQDTTAYGEDLSDGTDLETLLRDLVKVRDLRWIRLLYAYPKSAYFSDGLLDLIAGEEKICPYLDLPIQHIDDGILRRMARHSNSREIREILQKIRTLVPEISLRTSLIVGFPGETESRFESLLEFVRETGFDHLGAFKYSAEEGTPASRLPEQVPEEVKEERLGVLMELQKGISLKRNKGRVGKKVEAVVEDLDGETGMLRARLRSQAPEIDGTLILRGEAKPGDWVEAQITDALPYDLVGEITARSALDKKKNER